MAAIILESICQSCEHSVGFPYPYCLAFFPSKIPADILNGIQGHRSAIEGDRGFRFKTMKRTDKHFRSVTKRHLQVIKQRLTEAGSRGDK